MLNSALDGAMRFLLFLAVCFFCASPALAGKEDEEKSKLTREMEERSRYAAELFRKTCFMNFSDRDKLVSLLDLSYKRVPEEKRVEILGFVQALGGEAWSAVITPKLTYTVVSDTNGNCHVITQRSNAEQLHKEIKNLAMDVRDSMSFSVVDYKGAPKDQPVQGSKFDVKAPDGAIVLTVSVSTKTNLDTLAAEGVLSVIPPKK